VGEKVQLPRLEYLKNAQHADTDNGGSRLDDVIDMTARTGPRHARALSLARSPLVVSAILFAVIVTLRFTAHTPQRAGILLFLIGPIVVMSLAYRPRSGVVVASGALVAYLIGQRVDVGSFDVIGSATRAFTYYAIPLTIWLARIDAAGPTTGDTAEAPVDSAEPALKPLTARELEVLGLVAAGHTNAEIAEQLVLSIRTIESHRASLRRKLGRPSPAELVVHAERYGVLAGGAPTSPTDAVPRSDSPVLGLVY
jgi:DNA-binding CsgD family transcriptional regulator